MDSSDSEDDCYGNIAQKLQRMKNKYNEDKIDSTNLLDDSANIDQVIENTGESATIESKSVTVNDEEDSDSNSLEAILNMATKRVTRSSGKRTNASVTESTVSKPNKRKKNSRTPADSSTATTDDNTTVTSSNTTRNSTSQNTSLSRGRVRGRGRSRGRRSIRPPVNTSTNYPTYSVGNTDEYPDQSDNIQLFSSKSQDDVIIVEESETIDDNEELSVKVYWQSSEFFKFSIRRYQKLSQIFNYFSEKENVSNDTLLFTFNDRILKPTDTPDSISYSIAKFIDGGIVNQSVSKLVKSDSRQIQNGIKLKFQCQNVKKPFETTVGLDDKLSLAMMKCAEHFETAFDKLKFEFDGDTISGKITARELELEGGECIDVKISS